MIDVCCLNFPAVPCQINTGAKDWKYAPALRWHVYAFHMGWDLSKQRSLWFYNETSPPATKTQRSLWFYNETSPPATKTQSSLWFYNKTSPPATKTQSSLWFYNETSPPGYKNTKQSLVLQ